MYEHIQEGDAL